MPSDRDLAFPVPRGGRLVTGLGTTERAPAVRPSRPLIEDEPTEPHVPSFPDRRRVDDDA